MGGRVKVRLNQERVDTYRLFDLENEVSASAFQFAAVVTGFGQILRNSPRRGDVTYI